MHGPRTKPTFDEVPVSIYVDLTPEAYRRVRAEMRRRNCSFSEILDELSHHKKPLPRRMLRRLRGLPEFQRTGFYMSAVIIAELPPAG